MQLDPTKNFGAVNVSIGYSSVAVSVTLSSGQGALLPQPSTDGSFNLVWYNITDYSDASQDPSREIVRCTARSGDTLTITRAQESTTATDKNLAGKSYGMIHGPTAKMIADINAGLQGGFIITETPIGLINSSNKTYATLQTIHVVLALINNQGIFAPSVGITPNDFSYSPNTKQFTMTNAIDASMASTPFVIIYV